MMFTATSMFSYRPSDAPASCETIGTQAPAGVALAGRRRVGSPASGSSRGEGWDPERPSEVIDAHYEGGDTDQLNVLRVAKSARDHAVEPRLRQPSRVRDHTVDDIDDVRRERSVALVLPLDSVWRQGGLPRLTQSTGPRRARLRCDGDALCSRPPRPGRPDMVPYP